MFVIVIDVPWKLGDLSCFYVFGPFIDFLYVACSMCFMFEYMCYCCMFYVFALGGLPEAVRVVAAEDLRHLARGLIILILMNSIRYDIM